MDLEGAGWGGGGAVHFPYTCASEQSGVFMPKATPGQLNFFKISMSVLPVCVSYTCKYEKGASDPVSNPLWMLGIKPGFPARAASALNN